MLKNIKFGPKLMGAFILLGLMLFGVATVGYIKVRGIATRSNNYYSHNLKGIASMGLVNTTLEKMRGDRLRYEQVEYDRDKMRNQIMESIGFVNEAMEVYKGKNISAEEKSIIADFDANWPEMQRGFLEVLRLADANDYEGIDKMHAPESYMSAARKKTVAAITDLINYNISIAESTTKGNVADAKGAWVLMTTFAVLGLITALVMGFFFTRSITGPLNKVVKMIQEMGKGHVSERVHMDRKDEIGVLANTMDGFAEFLQKYLVKGMQQISEGNINIETPIMDDQDEIGPALKKMVESLNKLIGEMEFVTRSTIEGKLDKRADQDLFSGAYKSIVSGINATVDSLVGYIDKMPAPVMVIDNDFNIRYMNEAGTKLLKSSREQLMGSKCYNHFKTGDCGTGKCACGRAMADGRIANSETDAHPAGLDLEITYTGVPIKDQGGKIVGAFELVTDQTDIKKAQKLSQKISDYQSQAVTVVSKALEKLSQGDLNVEVEVGKGDSDTSQVRENFVTITKAISQTTEAVKQMTGDVNYLTQAALDGKLSTRADYKKHQGEYMNIVQGINNILDAVVIPMNETAAVLENIAAKDLTSRMKGEYKGDLAKIKEAMNTAADNLDKALQQVAIGAEQVASASVQVSTGGQALSQGTSEQASSLEEVSSSLQEMSSMTKQNTANAKEAKGVADQTRESSERGVESMSRLSSAINKIKVSSDSTAKIVKTIDEIAFQTNLLALNAAVEAARAGDAGKGFAVVAEEVRNLAMRSAEAAKNTANLIEDAVKNSENGVAINAEVLKNFQEINERTNKVSQVVAEISAASEQQDQGLSQVNKAVEQMNQVTQQNAANAEESASAAEEMSSQSEEMRSMVQGFKLTSSSDFNQALKASSQSGHMLYNLAMGKKGGKAAAGIQPDPRKIIPLDEKDHNILKTF